MLQFKPNLIEVDFVPYSDFNSAHYVRTTWHPFEAASLLSGAIDFRYKHRKLVLVFPLDKADNPLKPPFQLPGGDDAAIAQLFSLANVISREHGDSTELDPREVTRWALKVGLITPHHDVARAILGTDGTSNDHRTSAEGAAHAQPGSDVPQKAQASRPSSSKSAHDQRGRHHATKRENVMRVIVRELALQSGQIQKSFPRTRPGAANFNIDNFAAHIHQTRDAHADLLTVGTQKASGTSEVTIALFLRWACCSSKLPHTPSPTQWILRAAIRLLIGDTAESLVTDGKLLPDKITEAIDNRRTELGLPDAMTSGYSSNDLRAVIQSVYLD